MPTEETAIRKLRAILSADVKGYSLLMTADETLTIKTLKAYRKIMSSQIEQHSGRVVDAPGDNMLAEFASAVEAVQCAVEIQKTLKPKNEDLPADKRLEFRIGVNIGDVIQDGDSLFGEGVNIAARIEGLADPGGVCLSRNAYDHIKNKLKLGYEYIGEHAVKNIKDPVRVYKVLMDPADAGKLIGEEPRRPRKKWFLPVAVLAVIILTSIVWNFYQKFIKPEIEPASVEKMAYPLPDKPSIAVLPFDNMSSDPDQEFFSDGITEEIITALSKNPKLFVIARNSTFTYKGKSVKVQKVSEDLGVQYVLEGSVRKENNKVRISAQLIDAIKGHHLWAESYDRELKDIFSLQDEITMKILTALEVKLTDGEIARISAKGTENLQAYLKILQAREPFYAVTKEGFAQAKRLSEEAIALDKEYAAAYVYLGSTHFMDIMLGSSKSPKDSLNQAFKFINKAIALDESYSTAHSVLGYLYVMTRQYEKGIAECEQAIALEPNSNNANIWMSLVYILAGKQKEAVRFAELAIRLDPFPPPFYLRTLGLAYSWVGMYEKAIDAFKKSLQKAPDDIITHLMLTSAFSWAGRIEDARSQASEVLRINPKYSLDLSRKRAFYKNQSDLEYYLEGLRKAGIPETSKPAVPDKPSIAVLPFDNLSDDPEQEYFSDGMTDDIITDLSKIKNMLVISRNSTFTYKGKDKKIPEIAKELNVRYVLEGSIRRAGDQIRINAQLIDAATDHHVWAERFDDTMKNIFSLQDRITGKIVSALALKLSPNETNKLASKGTDNIEAHDLYLKGKAHLRRWTRDDLVKAIDYFKQALEMDPNYSQAYVGLAQAHQQKITGGSQISDRMDADSVTPYFLVRYYVELAMKNPTPGAYSILASLEILRRHYDEAIDLAEKAVALAPNDADSLIALGSTLMWADKSVEAIPYVKEAMRLNPLEANLILGFVYFSLEQYEAALESAEKSLQDNSKVMRAHLISAVSYAHLGREDEAKEAFNKYLTSLIVVYPDMQFIYFNYPFKNPAVFHRFVEGLVKAGYRKDPNDYYKVDAANKLNGEEIKELLFGKTMVYNWLGFECFVSIDEQGGAEWAMPTIYNTSYVGKSWVESDALCSQYKYHREGVKYCSNIYNNPEGSDNKKSEYLILGDPGLFPLSVLHQKPEWFKDLVKDTDIRK